MEEFVFKMVVLGEKTTGKTSLIRRYIHGSFEGRYAATIGLNVSNKKINLENSSINLLIYDIEAENDFESLFEPFVEGSIAVIFVFDITRVETFDAVETWVERMKNLTKSSALENTILIGNKIDLPRKIDKRDGEQLAKKISSSHYLETSAKENIEVDLAFHYLAERILERNSS
ncbi:MAG: GTPase KRas precursor [Candidatus Heimdallarchaeota archaeon LC_3]|nr:MAG: GTPase KRas precursor [Candidatus Heimdallarchaeota archaeon LC_3]